MGWGRSDQFVDPGFATHAFLNAMIRTHPAGGWMTGDIEQICQEGSGISHPVP